MSEFEKLATDLETLAKSSGAEGAAAADAATDKKIEAAAGEGAADEAAAAAGGKDAGPGDEGGGDDDDELLGKSFEVDRGGEKIKAYDATELLKSISGRLEALEETTPERSEHLGKSLGLISDLLKSQDEQIKTLTKRVEEMGSAGRGRKAIVTVNEKPGVGTLAKGGDQQPTGQEILVKCLTAQKAGRLTGMDVARADAAVGNGVAVPRDILARLPE